MYHSLAAQTTKTKTTQRKRTKYERKKFVLKFRLYDTAKSIHETERKDLCNYSLLRIFFLPSFCGTLLLCETENKISTRMLHRQQNREYFTYRHTSTSTKCSLLYWYFCFHSILDCVHVLD